MNDYQANYSEKFKDVIRKFNASKTAVYFIVQTSITHDCGEPVTIVSVYNKKKTIYWEAMILSEFDDNEDLIAKSTVTINNKSNNETITIGVVKRVIGFGIATSLEQVNEIITYMEADDRNLQKIYFYDYDLVIEELVPAKPDSPVIPPNFNHNPINSAWVGNSQYTIKGDTNGDDKKKDKKQEDEQPTGTISGFKG